MKIAKLLDDVTVAVTNDDHQPAVGDVLYIGSAPIYDPDTQENLGSVERVRIKVSETYERFFVAELSTRVPVSVGDVVRTIS